MRRVGLLLSGCGAYDGSDVYESVLLALAIRTQGMRTLFLAPDGIQADVVDHSTGDADDGAAPRRILLESARLGRGGVHPAADVPPSGLDALVVPGGMGSVRNLCLPGPGVLGGGPPIPEVAALLRALDERRVPLAAIGLGRVVLSRHRGEGLDPSALAVGKSEVVAAEDGRTLYTPGFLGSDSIVDVALGIDRLVAALASLLGVSPGLSARAGGG